MFEFTVRVDRSSVPSLEPTRVHALVEVRTSAPSDLQRLPLHLGLVIDVSGSMQGEKLRATQEALRNLLRRLHPEDRVALVAYSDVVQVVEQTGGSEKQRLIDQVARLRAGGNTNLSGGWLEGLAQVERERSAKGLHRVLLLTDGRANLGVTDPEHLAAIGRRGLEQGVRTTTLGFGADYDEDLLTRIADESGGNAYYIETPDHAANAFLQELGELGNVVGQNLELIVGCEPGVRLVDATSFPGRRDAHEALFRVGDLYANDVTSLLLSFDLEPRAPGERTLASVALRYRDVHAAGAERRDARRVQIVHAADPDPVAQDPAVLRELLLHRAARAKEAAVRLADQGQLAAAQGALAEELGTLREALTSDTQFGRADRALLEQELSQSRSLRDEFDEGSYSSLTRKQALMQSLLSRKKRGAYDARPPSS